MTATSEPDLSSALYDAKPVDEEAADLGTDFGGSEKPPELVDLDGKDDREKRPQPHGKRTPLADLVSLAWGGVGMALVQTEADVPVGRVMQFQAPLAGRKIDELLAHTWLDAILQPFAKQADKIEGLGAIVLFPLLVGAYERNQTIGPMVEPILRQVVRSTLADMAPILKKQQADTKRAAESVADLSDMMELEPGTDPVDAILASIFAPPPRHETGEGDEQ